MIKLKKIVAILCLTGATVCCPLAQASDGVEVKPLGTCNTLVRVTGEGKYLLLPVQESVEDAKIDLLADGVAKKTIHVRLAISRVDYYVPLDLSPYEGQAVLLNIVTAQGRSTVREAAADVCWKNITLADTFDTTNRERWRPAFHHTPLYGWMNDPNGMFYKDGLWHLCYQWNPYGSKWQNLSWGHSTSLDLINWTHHPAAIEPGGLGMVFSGSSVVDSAGTAGFGQNAVVALYTSAAASQTQSLAYSKDNGHTFELYAANPVITLDSEARDPNVFWDEEAKRWVLALAHALEHEMLFFTSTDLKEWTLRSAFGKGQGAQDGVWECPDLFKLKVEGTDEEKWVLVCNINPGGPFGGSATQYFIGDFDGTSFKADTDENGTIPTKWMDFGKDHYATVSWSNAPQNRRTMMGWMSNWQYAADVPTMQYRSANTLPREARLFKGADGQTYLASAPSPELTALRDKQVVAARSIAVGKNAKRFGLPKDNDGICEILLNLDLRRADTVSICLDNETGESVVLKCHAKTHTVSMDRRTSGLTGFNEHFPAVTVAPTFTNDAKLALRVFIDRSSIEVFGNDGHFVMTNLVFPTQPYSRLSVSAEGGKAKVDRLSIYSLKTSK